MRPRNFPLFAGLVVALLVAGIPSLRAQEGPKKKAEPKADKLHYEGQLKIGLHTLKLKEGRCYTIQTTTERFYPVIRMLDGNRTVNVNYRSRSYGRKRVYSFQVIPPETKEYKLLVAMSGYPGNPQTTKYPYEIRVTSTKPLLAVQERLDQSDPVHPSTNGYCKAYEFPLEKGYAYRMVVSSTQMNPAVYLEDADGKTLSQGPNYGNYSYVQFTPKTSGKYRMVASSYGKRYGYYTVMLTKLAPASFIFNANGKITAKDKMYRYRNAPYKSHKVKLKAGKSYQIEMQSKNMTPYLYLEDSNGRLISSGGRRFGLQVQLTFTAPQTGEYKIIATTNRGQTGQYSVSVQRGVFNMNSVAPPVILPPANDPNQPIAQPRFPRRPGIAPGGFGGAPVPKARPRINARILKELQQRRRAQEK